MYWRFITLFFVVSLSVLGHKTYSFQGFNTSLEEVLAELENSFDIKFSYNADIISKKQIQFNIQENESLLSNLLSIQSSTNLFFEKLEERRYAIRSKASKEIFKICGYTYDDVNGKPLSQCFVQNATGSIFSKSDLNGYFELYLSKSDDVVVFRLEDYLPKSLSVAQFDKNYCRKVELKADSYNLEEVLITDYLKNDYFSKNNEDTYSFNPSEMGVLPGNVEPDILETLQILPGVQGPTENATQLFIRGGNPSENLILWDGIKIYNSGHLFGSISSFNPNITENVNLYRSGFNPKYGGAISGIIDIQSENNVPEKLEGGLGITTTHADAFFKIPMAKKIGLIVSGRTSINSIFETGTFENYLNRSIQNAEIVQDQPRFIQEGSEVESIPQFSDFTSKIIVNINDRVQLGASGIYSNNQLDYRFEALEDSLYSPFEAGIQEDTYKEENIGGSIFLDYQVRDKLHLKISGYYSDYNKKYVNYERRYEEVENIEENMFFADSIDVLNKLVDRGTILTATWDMAKQINLESGIEFSETKVILKQKYFLVTEELQLFESQIDSVEDTNFSRAVFSNINVSPNNKLSINLGARVNDFSYLDYMAFTTRSESLVSTDRLYIDPRFSVRAQLFPKFRTRFIYERNHQLLNQKDERLGFTFQLNQNLWRFPEKNEENQFFNRSVTVADQFIAGWIYKGKNFSLDFDLYHKTINNSDLSDLVGSSNFSFNSPGTRTTRGMDVLVKKRFGNGLNTLIGYSLSEQEFEFAEVNNDQPFPGNYDSRHNLSIIQSAEIDNFEFSLGWKYRTGIPFHKDVSLDNTNLPIITINSFNDGRLPDYHRLDFTASYSSNTQGKSKIGYKIALSLLNLYDRRNTLQRLYLAKNNRIGSENDFFIDIRDTRSLGFTPNVSLRLKF